MKKTIIYAQDLTIKIRHIESWSEDFKKAINNTRSF